MIHGGETPATAQCLVEQAGLATTSPFFTVAVPHYKHRRYLEQVLRSVFSQSFQDFEIVISDDNSPDDSNQVIPELLLATGRPFRYYAQATTLGYDRNLRFCLEASRGRYVFLLGNDDALTESDTLAQLATALEGLGFPEVAVTSYQDWATGDVVHRARRTAVLGRYHSIAPDRYAGFISKTQSLDPGFRPKESRAYNLTQAVLGFSAADRIATYTRALRRAHLS